MIPLRVHVDRHNELECPCCHGERVIRVLDPATGKTTRERCAHCMGSGRIFIDQRSDNRHE